MLRITFLLGIVIGCGYLFHYNQRLTQLRRAEAVLKELSGYRDNSDPNESVIIGLPVPDDLIPPTVTNACIFRYRINCPESRSPMLVSKLGKLRSDSPQSVHVLEKTKTNVYRVPNEPIILTLAYFEHKHKGGGYFRLSRGRSSVTSWANATIASPNSFESLVVESDVAEGTEREFDTDEAVCLMRIRSREFAIRHDGEIQKDWYQGCVAYLFDDKASDAFDAWERGKISSMSEAR